MTERVFIAVLLVFFSPLSASAQFFSTIGVRGGMNLARISETGTIPGRTEFVLNYAFGLYGEIEVYRYLFLTYEFLYSVRGTSRLIREEKPGYDGGAAVQSSLTIKRSLTYVDPSVCLHLLLVESNRTRARVFAGASLALTIRARSMIDGILSGEPYESERNEIRHVLPIDPGVIIGVGGDYRLPLGNISVDFRYVHGLMNIWERGKEEVPETIRSTFLWAGIPTMHNRTFSLMVGFGF